MTIPSKVLFTSTAPLFRGRFGDSRGIAVGDIAVAVPVELVERLHRIVTHGLQAVHAERVELWIVRAPCRTARDFEYRLVFVPDDSSGFRIGARSPLSECAIFRPHADRERKPPNLVPRPCGVARHLPACYLFLHNAIGILVQLGMPQRVIAQLETLLVQILELRESPLRFLAFDSLVAEK